MFKRFLILLIVLFNSLNITAQDEQLYYKVQFDAITDFELPCNDGEGGIYYYKTSETINAEFKISDSYGEHIFNIGDYHDFTDDELANVTAKGSAIVTYNYDGSIITVSQDFDISDEEIVYLKDEFDSGCENEFRIPLVTTIYDAECVGDQRTLELICILRIMPYYKLSMEGQKFCTGDPIKLNAYSGQDNFNWQARINEDEWFDLELYKFEETTNVKQVYDKAPLIEVIDDSFVPPKYKYYKQTWELGDSLQFRVQHGCYGFDNKEPTSAYKYIYETPNAKNSIDPISPQLGVVY